MNKNLLIVAVILVFLVGFHFIEGNYWRNQFLQAPADTSKPVLKPPVLTPLAPDTSEAHRKPPILTPPVKSPPRGFRPPEVLLTVIDSLKKRITYLEKPSSVVLTDKEGGTHDILYAPLTEKFREIYNGFQITQPSETFVTRNLPEVKSPITGFFVMLKPAWQMDVGIGVEIGYDRISVGRIFIAGAEPVTFVSIKFTL